MLQANSTRVSLELELLKLLYRLTGS